MASFDWLARTNSKAAPRAGRRTKNRSSLVGRPEHLEDRWLLSVSPAPISTGHTTTGTPSNSLVVTNNYDYTSTQTPIPGSLRYEIAQADLMSSATITFNISSTSIAAARSVSAANTFHGSSSPSNPVITLIGGPLVISSSVNINGLKSGSQYGGSSWMPGGSTTCPTTGVTITQNNTAASGTLFEITAGTVQINGVTFLGGAGGTDPGGAVVDTDLSSVTFQNDVFTSNTAAAGGAIFANGGVLNINCSCFSLNTAADGGAIFYAGTAPLSVTNSQFTQNTANDFDGGGGAFGGAIAVTDSVSGNQLVVSGSGFTGNAAIGLASSQGPGGLADGGYGGAIAVLFGSNQGVTPGAGSVAVTSSTFNSNLAEGVQEMSGRAIWLPDPAALELAAPL